LHRRIIQEVCGCRCSHPPIRFRGAACRSPTTPVESSGTRSRLQRRAACRRGRRASDGLPVGQHATVGA
jgi:hypothetical protein